MSVRRRGREIALQILYQSEWVTLEDLEGALKEYAKRLAPKTMKQEDPALEFARSRLEGIFSNKESINQIISRNVRGWRLDRMASVDRNILRIGAFELMYCPDIPSRVVINEAVELAKKFGSEDSRAFVNGVLDGILKDLKAKGERKEDHGT